MLRVRSFKISEGAFIDDLLREYPLGNGAQILVSNGYVLIPYDDGEETPLVLKINRINQLIGEKTAKKEEMIHIQNTHVHKQRGVLKQLEGLEIDLEKPEVLEDGSQKSIYKDTKDIKFKIKTLENVREQLVVQIMQSQAEITNLNTDIEVYQGDVQFMVNPLNIESE